MRTSNAAPPPPAAEDQENSDADIEDEEEAIAELHELAKKKRLLRSFRKLIAAPFFMATSAAVGLTFGYWLADSIGSKVGRLVGRR
eukprot:tig00000383_g24705.t1